MPFLQHISWGVSGSLCGAALGSAMRFAELATLLVILLRSFGEISDEGSTHLQEDCAGAGNIACGARLFHLAAARRDVACLQVCHDVSRNWLVS